MKTFFTLFASLLMSITILAADARPKSMLTIKSVTQDEIRVTVDGKNFEPQDNTVMIENVDAGYHAIKVFRQKSNRFFNRGGKRFELIYNSSLSVEPATDILIAIDRYGSVDISKQRIQIKHGRDWDGNDDMDYDQDNRWDNKGNGRWEDERNYNGYAKAISDREFDQVMNSMSKEWFENNKLKSASYIIKTNFFTADQVKQMMLLFSFENNKLEIAKQAYSKTLDKQNYHCVSEVLNFRSSKEELARFIRTCE